MDKTERMKLVLAMEYIARQINNENIFESWLINGVADGDIDYGHFELDQDTAEILEYYVEDEEFAELMALFLRLMYRAEKDGGLYCDRVASK